MKASAYNIKEDKTSDINVSDDVFGVAWNPDLVHQAFVAQRSNKRQKAGHAKGRSEVAGGGAKPWRQKGTGRARHGSIRSPIWKGGGVTFGPNKDRTYKKKINKKMKRKALLSLLSKKLEEDEVKFVESLAMDEYKTKNAKNILDKMFDNEKYNALFVASDENKDINKAVSNIKNVDATSPTSLNVLDILSYKFLVIETGVLETIENHYSI